MLLELIVMSLVAVSPSLNSVVKPYHSDCTLSEYRCPDGGCISGELRCDGTPHCVGGADEASCHSSPDDYTGAPYSVRSFKDYHSREKRQNTRCTGAQWRCRSGQCIASDGRCDGVQNCADSSDEAHALCRSMRCPDHLFRCAYGACVDGYSKCDGEKNCVDNSDELHPDCFPGNSTVANGQFKCADGSRVSSTVACDGRADCADGSDETVRACGSTRCHSIHFQCAYGACVDTGSDCDNKVDCADGSDEADDLCNRMGTGVTTTTTVRPTPQPVTSGNCVLPPYPTHGRYVVEGNPGARPGQALEAASLSITCDAGYRVLGNSTYICYGQYGWFGQMPSCVRFCRLNPHKSVNYRCLLGTTGGSEDCPLYVPSGTEVVPTCNFPNYYSRFPLQYMRCRDDGQWNNIEICEPGESKEGTHITILVKDKVEIYVSKFNYTGAKDPTVIVGEVSASSPSNSNHIRDNDRIVFNDRERVVETDDSHLTVEDNKFLIHVSGIAKPTTQRSNNYDIDAGDWRIGSIDKVGGSVSSRIPGKAYDLRGNEISNNGENGPYRVSLNHRRRNRH